MIQKKICLLGATGVGKTSLVKRYVEGMFSEKYLTTIGVKVDKKQLSIEDTDIQLMIWDIEGIDRYCGFQPKYLRGAAAFIIVTDQTRSQSLVEGMDILRMAKEVTDAPAFLAINKSDLTASWHWTETELDEMKQQFESNFYTSAKTSDGVDDLFYSLSKMLVS